MSWEPRFLQGGVKKQSDEQLHNWIRKSGEYWDTRMRAKRELVKRTGVSNKDALKMTEREMDEILYGRQIGTGVTIGRAGLMKYRIRERGNGAPYYPGYDEDKR